MSDYTTPSAKFCDKVLVLPDTFIPFSGVLFCVTRNSLHFNDNKKTQEQKVTFHEAFYVLTFPFLKFAKIDVHGYILLCNFHSLLIENNIFIVFAGILGSVFNNCWRSNFH